MTRVTRVTRVTRARSFVLSAAFVALAIVISAALPGVLPTGPIAAPSHDAVVGESSSAAATDHWAETQTPSVATVGSLETITVISASEGLDPRLVAAFTALDGVVAISNVRSGTIGLLGSFDAAGVARDALAPGFRIPVTATALDPDRYAGTLLSASETDTELIALITPGQVLLSISSATLRGVGVGGTVDLGDAAGLRVVGVVDDRTARGSEFLLHIDDADVAGLGPREALLVRHEVAGSERLVAMAESLDDELRVWRDRDHVRLVLSQVELKARFGEFAFRPIAGQREVDIDRAFVDEHITIERMPVLGNVRCHRLVMDDLRAALEELVDAGLEEWLAPRRFGGCFHPRRIATGRENLSRHTWGIAIDLNVDFSLPGSGPVPPDEFIAIMGRNGFRWGGDFATPDNHHYEWGGEFANARPPRERA